MAIVDVSVSSDLTPSRLRINFRQFVGDVEWLACAESSSGQGGFDGEIGEQRLHIDADSFVVTVDAGPVRVCVPSAGCAPRPGSGR